MRKSGKVGITVLMMFVVFIALCVALSTSEPISQPELNLEVLTRKHVGELHTQCYATNSTDKTWKDSVQMRLYRLDGSILHSSANHIWIDVKIEPGERTFYAAKVEMPWIDEFIIEWEWGRKKIRTEYKK